MTDPEFYVEIEVPRGDVTTWEVVGAGTDRETADELYNHFLDLGMQVQMTTWTLQVVRAAPPHPDVPARPATVEASVQDAQTELAGHRIVLPSAQDLLAQVEAEIHKVSEEGRHLIGELRHNSEDPAPISKIPGQDDAAEQQGDLTQGDGTGQALPPMPSTSPAQWPWNAATASDVLGLAAKGGIAQPDDHVVVSVPTTITAAPEGMGKPADPAETSVDIPVIPKVDPDKVLMPGDPGYIQYMISRGDQGTRISRSQV